MHSLTPPTRGRAVWAYLHQAHTCGVGVFAFVRALTSRVCALCRSTHTRASQHVHCSRALARNRARRPRALLGLRRRDPRPAGGEQPACDPYRCARDRVGAVAAQLGDGGDRSKSCT